jgi:hypothetical protein
MIALGHTFTHWCPATFYLLLPFLVKEMGLSYSQAGFLVTIRAAANLLINIPAGMLVDLIGKKALLMALALVATGVPYFLVGVSENYFWIALFMAFVGVGNYSGIRQQSRPFGRYRQTGLRHRHPRHTQRHKAWRRSWSVSSLSTYPGATRSSIDSRHVIAFVLWKFFAAPKPCRVKKRLVRQSTFWHEKLAEPEHPHACLVLACAR